MGPIGWPELLIILAVVLLLFGGTRLAGIGKASGKAIREFKEETKGLNAKQDGHATDGQSSPPQLSAGQQPTAGQPDQPPSAGGRDAEAVDPNNSAN